MCCCLYDIQRNIFVPSSDRCTREGLACGKYERIFSPLRLSFKASRFSLMPNSRVKSYQKPFALAKINHGSSYVRFQPKVTCLLFCSTLKIVHAIISFIFLLQRFQNICRLLFIHTVHRKKFFHT